MEIPRYAGLPQGQSRYWVPYEEGGVVRGWQRSLPRNYKIFPEKNPVFVVHKPANGFRLFCLGESSVMGLPYEVGAFSEWLQVRLAAMMPGRTVEIVNAGNAGWHATEIRELLEESLDHKPDLFIWMVGHNEMVPQNVLNIRRELTNPARATATKWIRSLTITQGLSRIVPSLSAGRRENLHDRESFEGKPCATPAEVALIKFRYREAMEGAILDARAARVPMVVCTMPRNFREHPPGASTFSDNLLKDAALQDRWNHIYNNAVSFLQKGDLDAAGRMLDNAAQIDSTPAKLHFVYAQLHDALGETGRATEKYKLALESDGCPMRACDWVEDTIRATATALQTPLVDLDGIFNNAGKGGLAGSELICDNVHPNLAGHEAIANAILDVLEKSALVQFDRSLDLPPEITKKRLRIHEYDEFVTLKSECLANFRLVVQAGNVDALWTKTNVQIDKILTAKPEDWETQAALGVMEIMAGKNASGKERIEKAMASDDYVRISHIFYYYCEEPYARLLRKGEVDIKTSEATLPPSLRTVLNNRMARHRTSTR